MRRRGWRTWSFAWTAALAACGPVWAQTRPDVASEVVQVSPARPASVALPGGATMLPALTYAQPSGYRPLTLDLYRPPATRPRPAGGFPLVIYVHGGGWMAGDPRKSGAFVDFPAVLGSLAARGYVVASVSYRFSAEARFPAQAQDIRAAVRWLKAHADPYGVDPGRTVIWGASAGGHLAALAATGCRVAAFDPPPPGTPMPGSAAAISPCVQGAVIWYGVTDLATIDAQARAGGAPGALPHGAADAAEWRLLGCDPSTCRNGEIALASPVTHVSASSPPMLLIAGTVDRQVPHAQSEEMAKALTAAGVPNRLLLYPAIDHSWIGSTPAATRKASLDALAETFAFIDRTIGGGR